MSGGELLQQALALHQKGQLDAALGLYGQVLVREPAQFDALHLSGVIARQQGRPTEALALIEQALAIDASRANAHCNLGAALQDLDRPSDALASYERAIALAPGYALAHSNRGNALRKLGRLDEAVDSYSTALALQPGYPEAACQRAIALHALGRDEQALASADLALRGRPRYADALAARGNALQALGHCIDAIASYDAALALSPSRADVLGWRAAAQTRLRRFDDALASHDAARALRPNHAGTALARANVLRLLGRRDEAVAAYREALALGADAAQVGYALAALGEGAAPAQAPAAYVTALFDQYAGHFDAHLVEQLAYRTPALIGAALARAGVAIVPGQPAALDIVDLGCGTGLCAPLLRPLARSLTGVDLSPNMLAQAASRQLYDALERADLSAYLSAHPASADVLVAADVLVYIGDLHGVFSAARTAARPGALFCFSVERGDDAGGFALAASQRYVHGIEYVRAMAAGTGWRVVEATEAHLRDDGGRAVEGFVVVMQ